MSSGLRPEEEWAQRVISIALDCQVEQHDDNSAPSMFDLRVGHADAPSRAIEVVGAIDEDRTKTWNTGIAKGSVELAGVAGDWTITIPGLNPERCSGTCAGTCRGCLRRYRLPA